MQPEIPPIFLRRTMCEALVCHVILRKQVKTHKYYQVNLRTTFPCFSINIKTVLKYSIRYVNLCKTTLIWTIQSTAITSSKSRCQVKHIPILFTLTSILLGCAGLTGHLNSESERKHWRVPSLQSILSHPWPFKSYFSTKAYVYLSQYLCLLVKLPQVV